MSKIFIGIDWGGTLIKLGIFNQNKKLISRHQTRYKELAHQGRFFSILKEYIYKMLSAEGLSLRLLKGVGVGAPGIIEVESGLIYYLPNIKGWRNFPFRKVFQAKIGSPLAIDNDANVAALAELKQGGAKVNDRAMLFTLGTGLGTGLILGGEVFRGKTSAVEGGHIPLTLEGQLCGCGARGCVETFIGNKYFIKKARRILKKYRCSLKDYPRLTPEDLYQLALKKNKAALESWKYYGTVLGRFSCGLVNLLNLEKIILSGGLSKAMRFFKPSMVKTIRSQAMRPLNTQVAITRSTLGDDAGIIGAFELINQQARAKR